MKLRRYSPGRPTSPEERIIIPPDMQRPADDSARSQTHAAIARRRSIRVESLPAGQLAGLFRKKHSKTSQEEVARRVGQAVLAVAEEFGMYPPPPMPPTDPGPAPDIEEGIIPIGDQEFGIVRTEFDRMIAELAYRGSEEGGVLFGPPDTQLASFFVRDRTGIKTPSSFTLDTSTLNAIIRRAKPWNLELKAIVHCHPPNIWRPSAGDIRYVRRLFAHSRNGAAQQIFMPLVVNGIFIPYLLYRNQPDRIVRARLKIIG